ncbi:MAG TPA: ABC transporter permease [Vicinamibacterales bacterium]|nr:ABC transporter permease [Vicinamibacterales bacterium]
MWETAIRDVRHALRALRSSPGFTAVALALLALGIGANTAIFSVVSAVLLRPLPFPEPDRLVLLWENMTTMSGPARVEASPGDYVSWSERNRSFSGVAGYGIDQYSLTGAGNPDKLTAVRTSGNLFAVLGTQPLLGRTLTSQDDRPHAPAVVVLDERAWRSRFAADAGVVGRTVHLNGVPHTVVGVVPADFRFPDRRVALFIPSKLTPVERELRSGYFMYVVARLKPEVSLAQAQADMTALARQLGREFPRSNGRTGVTVAALHEHLTREVRPSMAILLAAVGLVLLIAGANLANLLLIRGATRVREIAVRQALGATPGRVTRQLLTENAVLAFVGALLGVALAVPALRYLARLTPTSFPDATTPALDMRVFLVTAGITMVMVLGFGTAPAFAAARVHLESAIRTGASRSTTGRSRLRSVLIVAELALTVVLVVGAGLLLRSYANVLAIDPGFDPHRLLLAETPLPPLKYADTPTRYAFLRSVTERVGAIPGVTAAGFANFPPMVFKGGRAFIAAEGEPPPPPADISRSMTVNRTVGEGYFGALGVPFVRGRDFDDRDAQSGVPVVIVNRTFAERRWPNQDPIGRRIKFGPSNAPGIWMTVVGVVGDIREMALETPADPEIYGPSNQGQGIPPFLWPQYLLVRTAGDPLAVAAAVRAAVWSVDRDQAVSNIRTMDDVFDVELQNRNTQLTLVGAFALLAFVMAAIGLYGVLAYSVAQRLPEIGVRVALGAARRTVVAETLRGAMALAAVGIGLGLVVSFAASRGLQRWLFEVSPLDASTFAGTALLLALMALLASAIPAARGASVDPVRVLRAE